MNAEDSNEQWRPVVGAEGLYEISDHGHIRSLHMWRGKPGPRAIYVGTGHRGHQKVWLRVGGERLPRWVHQLVIEAFVGPRPVGMEVRHLDGDAANNMVQNLAYGTHSENELDKVRHGTHHNAAKTHCKRGHEFTPENIRQVEGGRGCRTCINAQARSRIKTPEYRAYRAAYMREYNRRAKEIA